MKRNYVKYLTLLLLSAAVLNSCKKGEEDPFLSLASRTNRLVGEWQVQSLDYTVEKESSTDDYVATYSYANGTKTVAYDDGTYYVYKYYDRYTFDKNGTYKRRIEFEGGDYVSIEGNWSWLKKNKDLDLKNKEAILLTITKLIESQGSNESIDYYEGKINRVDDILIFKRLTKDEFIIDNTYTHKSNGDYLYTCEGSKTYSSN